MKTRLLQLIVLVAVVFPVACFSEETTRKTSTLLGPRSCREWTENEQAPQLPKFDFGANLSRLTAHSWLVGYVSGINALAEKKDLLASIDADTIFEWMTKYCLAHSQKDVSDGAGELMLALAKM